MTIKVLIESNEKKDPQVLKKVHYKELRRCEDYWHPHDELEVTSKDEIEFGCSSNIKEFYSLR